MPFISCSCLITLARTSSTMLSNSGREGILVFFLYCPLYHHKMSIFASCYPFTLNSILSDIRTATPALLWICHLFGVSFFTLPLWVYICRRSIWFRFLIQFTILCHFIGEFSPFTFRVITDVWGFPTTILSFVFWQLCVSLTSFPCVSSCYFSLVIFYDFFLFSFFMWSQF